MIAHLCELTILTPPFILCYGNGPRGRGLAPAGSGILIYQTGVHWLLGLKGRRQGFGNSPKHRRHVRIRCLLSVV